MSSVRELLSERFNIDISDHKADDSQISDDDLNFLRAVMPKSIKPFAHYTKIGDKYVAVFLVNEFPKQIRDLAFTDLFNKHGHTATMDLEVGPKSGAVKELEDSINELDTRFIVNRKSSEDYNDAREKQRLVNLHAQLQDTAEMMGYITLRFFIYANSPDELIKKKEALEEDLSTLGLYGYIPEYEQMAEYRSLTNSANTLRQSIPVQGTLQGQFPFYFQSHKDPHGILWGITGTNGLVLLDPFRIIGDRMSYDMLFLGKKGAGKSTLLKYLMQTYYAMGHKIMALDIEGELVKFAKKVGIPIIRPFSAEGLSNMLELRNMYSAKYDQEEGVSTDPEAIVRANYTHELSRVVGEFYQLFPKMSELVESELKNRLTAMYRKRGITSETPLNRFTHADFPVMHDLLHEVQDELYTRDDFGKVSYKASVSEHRRNQLETLESYLEPYCNDGMYAPLFDHISTVDISKEDFIVFDMSMSSDLEENVFNALFYDTMAVMWSEVYKNRVLNEGVPEDDQRYCICVFDEAQVVVNTRNVKGLEFVNRMTSRDRKYLAALWFATQHPKNFAPSGADQNLDKIKTIFSLVQYKILMQQDESDFDILQELFPQFTRSEIESTALFRKGEQLLSMGAGAKIHCTAYIPQKYINYFGGGR